MKKQRRRTIVVRPAALERTVKKLHARGCTIVESKTVVSERRRRGIVKHPTRIIIRFIDPAPFFSKPAPFYEASGQMFGRIKKR